MNPFASTSVFSLANGREVIIREIEPVDYPAVSALALDNFRHAENFKLLDTAARHAYMEANSVLGVQEASENAANIRTLVAVDPNQNMLLAYRLLREGKHRITGEKVAEGKRLHVARDVVGQGLGTQLILLSCETAKKCGYRVVTAQATGKSRIFFEKMGFRCLLEDACNTALKQRGINSTIAYLELRL
jgi:predicted N-acetyltransferase YhbS